MLAQMQSAASKTAPAENDTGESWSLVKKSKKRKNKDRSMDVDIETDGVPPEPPVNVVAVDDNADYVIKYKSKKKKKEQRARDDGLAECLGSMSTEITPTEATTLEETENDSHQNSRQKKKKKRKLEVNEDESPTPIADDEDAPVEKKPKKTSRKEKMREAIKMAEERNGVVESDDGLDVNKFKKKKKKRKDVDAAAEDFSSGDEANKRVRESNASEEAAQKPVTAQKVLKEQKRLAKIARKMERSLNC